MVFRASLSRVVGLTSFDRASVFGLMDSEDGPEEFVFGSISDAAVDAAGQVLLLDSDYSTIRVLNPSRRSIQIVSPRRPQRRAPGRLRGESSGARRRDGQAILYRSEPFPQIGIVTLAAE